MNSPCIKVCKLSAVTHLCIGCYRTLQEIQNWPYMNSSEKLEVLDEIILRRTEFAATNGR